MNRFWHWGQMGDVIYSLPTIKALGGGELVLAISGPRFDFLAPLLRAQPYLSSVTSDPEGHMHGWDYRPPRITHDLNRFRLAQFCRGLETRPLMDSIAIPFGVKVPREPWIERPTSGTRTIAGRSFRYRSPGAREKYPPVDSFVGLQNEYEDFNEGEYLQCDTAVEMARAIARSALFVGNQSFPLSLAIAMGVPHRVETAPNCTNCVLEDYPCQLGRITAT